VSRSRVEVAFIAVVAVLLAWVIWGAQEWDLRARLFPLTVAIPVLALLAIYLVLTLVRGGAPKESGLAAEFESGPAALGGREAMRRGLVMAGWTIAFALGVWLLGFRIGSGVLAFAYLRAAGHEKWTTCILYALGAYAVLALGFDELLGIDFPPGVLQRLAGLDVRFL